MRFAELMRREDAFRILAETLASAWTSQHGQKFDVSTSPLEGGQPWRLQPLLAFCHAGEVRAEVRRFFVNNFRFTPRKHLAPAQWALGTLLGTRAGLRFLSRDALWVRPAVPSPETTAVLPGNQRVRIFDFQTGLCRVVLKEGFSLARQRAEVAVRARAQPGPFLPVISVDPAGRWFEEPLVRGFSLPRCPPWLHARRFERTALSHLNSWLQATTEMVDGRDWAAHLSREIAGSASDYGARFGRPLPLDDRAERWAEQLAKASRIPVALSHGDFQPGNILVDPDHARVFVIDWEYAERRLAAYDLLVFGLGSRFPQGLRVRLLSFLGGASLSAELPISLSVDPRRILLAGFLLEELRWWIAQATAPGLRTPPPGLALFLRETSGLLT